MLRISIIGGGIGGLSAALALRAHGFEPQVLEEAPQLLDVGAAIAVWPNAMRLLHHLGLGPQILEHAGVIEDIQWREANGRVLRQVQLPQSDAPAVALHRADLQTALLHALPESSIRLNSVFIGYDQNDADVRAHFADGFATASDVLIGADGLHSVARAQSIDHTPPVDCGYTVWRGIAQSNLTTTTAIEIHGRGKRFGVGPVGLGRTGWWATVNKQLQPDTDGTDEQNRLLALFSEWCDPVQQLIAATPTNSILRNQAFDRPSLLRWTDGRMTLLGDAAHPMTPNLGQGGCMAIEDAVVLAQTLDRELGKQQRVPLSNVRAALQTYERRRQTRTAAIARCSRLYGGVGQWENEAAARFRAAALSRVPTAVLLRVLRLVFDYSPFTTS